MKNLLNFLNERLFSSTYQIQRIVIYVGIAFVLAAVSFGSYYYYDRYYTNQPEIAHQTVAEAEQAVRDDPGNLEARMNLAEAYMISRRFDDALVQANQVLEVEAENQRAWLVIGVANANTGKPSDAIDPLTKFVNARKDGEMPGLDTQLQSAAYYLGDSYLQLGQPDKAVEPLEQAVVWSQTDADSLYKLGMAYSGIQDYENAVLVLQRATVFVPDFREAYEAMANAYEAGGYPDLIPYARGMVAYSQKDYPAAIDLLLKTLQAQPTFSPAFTGLGMTYEAMGDLQNAKTNYETAVTLTPDDFTASQGILRLEAALKK